MYKTLALGMHFAIRRNSENINRSKSVGEILLGKYGIWAVKNGFFFFFFFFAKEFIYETLSSILMLKPKNEA